MLKKIVDAVASSDHFLFVGGAFNATSSGLKKQQTKKERRNTAAGVVRTKVKEASSLATF